MKDQSNTGETVYRNAAGKKISEADYRRLQGGQADKDAGFPAGKAEVAADDHGTDASRGKN